MKLLVIGQAPSQRSELGKALEGSLTASKLAKLFGCTVPEYLAGTERLNVLDYWPGKAGGKGDRFPLVEVRERAYLLREKLRGRKILFVGISTAAAFGCGGAVCEWRQQVDERGWVFSYAILPHVSGINRWFNESKHKRLAKQFMQYTWAWRNSDEEIVNRAANEFSA